MRPFEHHDAESLEEAFSLLREYGGKARMIAGGTDLLGVLKDEILEEAPDALINLKTIAGLDTLTEEVEGLRIGALARLADIASSPSVRGGYTALSEAAETVASPEIRSMGTIGGNLCQDVRCWYYRYPHHMGGRFLCHRKGSGPCLAIKGDNRYNAIMGSKACFAVCPSDTAIALTALEARLALRSPEGEREIPVTDLYSASGLNLRNHEILTEIHVPSPPVNARQHFLKFTLRKPVDFAIVSVASVITVEDGMCRDAKIVLGAVAPTPVRATDAEDLIKGEVINEALAARAAEKALPSAKPLSGNAYKIEIVKALVRQAILA